MLIRPLIRFKLLLGLRVLIAYSSNSIVLLWVCIELNILSFLPILGASDNKSLENSIKYFLIQRPSSILFLMSLLGRRIRFKLEFIIRLAILLKLGRSPFHGWFLSILNNRDIVIYTLLATVQKLIPLLVFSLSSSKSILIWIIGFNFLTVLFLVRYRIRFIKLIGLRRLNRLNWMLVSRCTRINLIKLFFWVYLIILLNINCLFPSQRRSNHSIDSIAFYEKILIFFSLLSLGGVPPLLGFIPKLLVIQILMSLNRSSLIIILIGGSVIILIFYFIFIYKKISINPRRIHVREVGIKIRQVASMARLAGTWMMIVLL